MGSRYTNFLFRALYKVESGFAKGYLVAILLVIKFDSWEFRVKGLTIEYINGSE